MSLDKSEGGGAQPPSSHAARIVRRAAWTISLGPLVMLPFLLLAAVIWGVCLRLVYELFILAWHLFNF
jgi:hypothetical protein